MAGNPEVCFWVSRKGVVEQRESGKPAFGFALFLWPSELLECGNRNAISKGGGKGGKPDFGFPCFPRTVTSTALLLISRWGKGFHRCLARSQNSGPAISARQRICEDSVHASLRTTMAAASVQPEAMLVETKLGACLRQCDTSSESGS